MQKMLHKALLIIGLVLTSFQALRAQTTPQVLYDIYPGNSNFYGCYNLYFGARMGNFYYFSGSDSSTHKLFKTDGTAAGTVALKDVTQVLNMKVYNGMLYFGFIDTGAAGASLWKSDGTVPGTQLVKAFGGVMHAPHSFNEVNGKMFFCSSNSQQMGFPKKLYVSDGSAAGTFVLDSSLVDIGFTFGTLNNRLLFSASNSADTSYLKRELYITDGTIAGTQLVKDIKSGPLGSNPHSFITYNGKVYFGADDGVNGTELWVTDGTTAGTQMVKDINPGNGNAFFTLNIGSYNGTMYLGADDGVNGRELWVSDGTAPGTVLLKDIKSGANGSNPFSFVEFAGKVFFTADNGTEGNELWSSDGTAAGTTLFKDINPGAGSSVGGLYPENRVCNNKLYFDATDAPTGSNIEPWTTDGTVANTQKLSEIHPSTTDGSLDYETRYVLLNGKILFKANDPVSGAELHSVDEACSPLSVSEREVGESWSFSPNPSQGLVHLQGSRDWVGAIYSLTDLQGRIIQQGTLYQSKQVISVLGLPAGVYLLSLSKGENRQVRRLLID